MTDIDRQNNALYQRYLNNLEPIRQNMDKGITLTTKELWLLRSSLTAMLELTKPLVYA